MWGDIPLGVSENNEDVWSWKSGDWTYLTRRDWQLLDALPMWQEKTTLILLSLVKPALFVTNVSLIGLLDSLVDTALRCGFESQIWRRLNVYRYCLFHSGSKMCNPYLNAYQHKNNFNKIYSTVKLNKNPQFVRLCNKKAQHSILVFLYTRIYQCNEKIWIEATLLEPWAQM